MKVIGLFLVISYFFNETISSKKKAELSKSNYLFAFKYDFQCKYILKTNTDASYKFDYVKNLEWFRYLKKVSMTHKQYNQHKEIMENGLLNSEINARIDQINKARSYKDLSRFNQTNPNTHSDTVVQIKDKKQPITDKKEKKAEQTKNIDIIKSFKGGRFSQEKRGKDMQIEISDTRKKNRAETNTKVTNAKDNNKDSKNASFNGSNSIATKATDKNNDKTTNKSFIQKAPTLAIEINDSKKKNRAEPTKKSDVILNSKSASFTGQNSVANIVNKSKDTKTPKTTNTRFKEKTDGQNAHINARQRMRLLANLKKHIKNKKSNRLKQKKNRKDNPMLHMAHSSSSEGSSIELNPDNKLPTMHNRQLVVAVPLNGLKPDGTPMPLEDKPIVTYDYSAKVFRQDDFAYFIAEMSEVNSHWPFIVVDKEIDGVQRRIICMLDMFENNNGVLEPKQEYYWTDTTKCKDCLSDQDLIQAHAKIRSDRAKLEPMDALKQRFKMEKTIDQLNQEYEKNAK